MAKQGPPIQFRDTKLEEQLKLRSMEEPSIIAKNYLRNFMDVLEVEWAAIEPTFEGAELTALYTVGSSIDLEVKPRLFWAEVDEAYTHGILEYTIGISKTNLINKIRSLSNIQCLALMDNIRVKTQKPKRLEDLL